LTNSLKSTQPVLLQVSAYIQLTMARPKKQTKSKVASAKVTRVTKASKSTSPKKQDNYFEKIESDIKTNQSTLSLVLGVLIVLVVAFLIFNFFKNKTNSQLGPAQNTTTQAGDVTPESLPGKYTVKDGDTLFEIANKYYKDGYKFDAIAKANDLSNPDTLEVGQTLEIPKLDLAAASPSASTTAELSPTSTPAASVDSVNTVSADSQTNTQTQVDTNDWGSKINGDTYTVSDGDWLSTIAARAYGDVYAYNKIAIANAIQDPNLIEPGTVLKIPR